MAINIYDEDKQKHLRKPGNLKPLNTDIWNNEEVTRVSGYTIVELRECLYLLAQFISSSLSPNRLESFDIEGIKQL